MRRAMLRPLQSSLRIPRGIVLSPFEIPESHKKEKKSIAFLFRI